MNNSDVAESIEMAMKQLQHILAEIKIARESLSHTHQQRVLIALDNKIRGNFFHKWAILLDRLEDEVKQKEG